MEDVPKPHVDEDEATLCKEDARSILYDSEQDGISKIVVETTLP